MTDAPRQIETPSGKGAADENFPVGSFLLPKRLRPHVATYYAFARAIDDIADNPDTLPQDKIARLNAMDDALLGRTANPAAAHFDLRLDVVQCIMEQLDRIGLGLGFDRVERAIDDLLGNSLFAIQHQVVHELRQNLITELGIRKDLPLGRLTTT